MTSRRVVYALFWFVLWPVASVVFGVVDALRRPISQEAPLHITIPAAFSGLVYLTPEFLVCALIFAVVAFCVNRFVIGKSEAHWLGYLAECVLAYCGIIIGVTLEFPAVLNHSLFWWLHDCLVVEAYFYLVFSVVVFGYVVGRMRGGIVSSLRVASAPVIFIALGWGLTFVPVWSASGTRTNSAVLLGVDSLSPYLDLTQLKQFSRANSGTYYEQAISPGLVTNAVWTAIIEHRPIQETGVVLPMQTPDWSKSQFNLISEAKRHGYESWGYFGNQDVVYIGHAAGFDRDRSSPLGWVQLATVSVKDGSVLLPFVVSKLPRLPIFNKAPNQAGTYAYDLRATIRKVLNEGGTEKSFVVADIEYLHHASYPRFSDLAAESRVVVRGSDVSALEDFSADWQYPYIPNDLIGVYAWKVQHVQKVLIEELTSSGFLASSNNNRLVIFSDHGIRKNLALDNFQNPKFYHVPLFTFGVPAKDAKAAISTLSIPELLGFSDSTAPAYVDVPKVQYTNLESMDSWRKAVLDSNVRIDGRMEFRPAVVQRCRAALRTYDAGFDGKTAITRANSGSKVLDPATLSRAF